MDPIRNWDARKALDKSVYDYMVRKKMYKAARIFAAEAKVSVNSYPLGTEEDSEDLLIDWWRIFWDKHFSRLSENAKDKEDFSNKAQDPQGMENALQNMAIVATKPEMNQLFPVGTDFDSIMRQSASGQLAANIYEEQRLKYLSAVELDSKKQLLGVKELALSSPSSSNARYAQQELLKKAQERAMRGITLGSSLPMDPTLHGVPKALLTGNGLHDTGMDKGVDPVSLKGWSPIGLDQIPHGLEYQILNSLSPVPNQQQMFLTAPHNQQDVLAPVMAQTPGTPISNFPGSTSSSSADILPRNESSGTSGQMRPPMRRMMIPTTQTVEQRRIAPIRQTAEQQQNDRLKQEHLRENSRKTKILSHSHDRENASDYKDAWEDQPFSFRDDANADIANTTFSRSKRLSTVGDKSNLKGLSFEEIGCFRPSNDKLLCCHFSSDGRILASAGHGKKVSILNIDSHDVVHTDELHSDIITDVRFKPYSTLFATSSVDGIIQIWDANKPSEIPVKLIGHAGQVMSLDFNPKNVNLLYSCDSNSEIWFWDVKERNGIHISSGATRQVRFEPKSGSLLAATAGNGISVSDVETGRVQYYLQGHVRDVISVCWDSSGKYIASVSEDSARVWSIALGGKCIHELRSKDNKKFKTCLFHPTYALLLVIGCYQSIILWNPTQGNRTSTVAAHNDIIAALADSPQTELIASASHDEHVKLWR